MNRCKLCSGCPAVELALLEHVRPRIPRRPGPHCAEPPPASAKGTTRDGTSPPAETTETPLELPRRVACVRSTSRISIEVTRERVTLRGTVHYGHTLTEIENAVARVEGRRAGRLARGRERRLAVVRQHTEPSAVAALIIGVAIVVGIAEYDARRNVIDTCACTEEAPRLPVSDIHGIAVQIDTAAQSLGTTEHEASDRWRASHRRQLREVGTLLIRSTRERIELGRVLRAARFNTCEERQDCPRRKQRADHSEPLTLNANEVTCRSSPRLRPTVTPPMVMAATAATAVPIAR